MKKLYIIILIAIIGLSIKINAQIVNIPDTNFYNALLANGVHDSAGYITVDTAKAFTGPLLMYGYPIFDLTGIQAFKALTYLKFNSSRLTSVDLTSNTAITYLNCSNNTYIKSLNVSNCINLAQLYCSYDDSMTSLYLPSHAPVDTLVCDHNKLTGLDVSGYTALRLLLCNNNNLTGLDVSSNTALVKLDCSYNYLTSLDISPNTTLRYLYCENDSLTSLNLSSNTALQEVDCGYNKLTSLDLSFDTNLIGLLCYVNNLTSLDVSSNIGLADLYCAFNNLTSLNLSSDTALSTLECEYNSLTSLDLSSNRYLVQLACFYNNLTSLNVKNGINHQMDSSNFITTHNPNLTCIQVDDPTFSTANWKHIDSTSHFSTNCSLLSVNEIKTSTDVNIYPNPVSSQLIIESKGQRVESVIIYNTLGQIVNTKKVTGNEATIDMNGEPSGIYYIRITADDETTINKKIIKQ